MTAEPPNVDQDRSPPQDAARPSDWLRSRLTRRGKALIAIAIVVVLAVGALLARWLQTENVERDADVALLQAQASGDVPGMLRRLDGCRTQPSCLAVVQADARNPRLLRQGSVKILQLGSNTAYTLTGATGKTRVAWTVIGKLPVVQCVTVRRTGNFLTGMRVQLTALSAPIQNEAGC